MTKQKYFWLIIYLKKKIVFFLGKPRTIRDPFKEKTSQERLKLEKQQIEVTEAYKKAQEEQIARAREREIEKKRDLEMLKSYNPWGRPGGGAPIGKFKENIF